MTGKRYGSRFPDITVGDIVATQRALLDHLGIERLVAIVGPSYGGFQAFQWAVDYPNAMKGIAAVVTTPALTPERSDGNLVRLLATLSRDPNWNGGDYYDRGGVLESMIQIRIPTLKTYGIEARLRDTLSDPAAIEAAIRDEAARWRKASTPIAADPGEGAALFRRHRAARQDQGQGALCLVAHRQAVSAGPRTRRDGGTEGCGRRCRLLSARQRIRPFGVRPRRPQMGAAAAAVHGEAWLKLTTTLSSSPRTRDP